MNRSAPVPPLAYSGGTLHMDGVELEAVAGAVGTPAYVYGADHIAQQYEALTQAFAATPHHIHYAVKANSNIAVLELLHRLGAGFDIVSGGELSRLLAIDVDPKQIVFSGVGKSTAEITFALQSGVGCLNIESAAELVRTEQIARQSGLRAPISLRVNPNVDANTHPYISTGLKDNKFGVPVAQAFALYEQAAASAHLDVVGIDCHIGSQIGQLEPLLEALASLLDLVDRLSTIGVELQHIDVGGGFGITYADEQPLDIAAYGAAVGQMMGSRPQKILLEPGRMIVANAGVLLTRVEYLKPGEKNFAVVDAAMNDLIRPALYQAWHPVHNLRAAGGADEADLVWDIVGPVCESGDFLAKQRTTHLQAGDVLAIGGAGAYGFVQASNYNSRPRPCEVLIQNGQFHVVRRRESIQDLLSLEQRLPR